MRKIRVRTLGFFILVLFAAGLTAIVLRWISLEQWHRTQLAPETPVEIEIPEKTPTPAASPKIPIIAGKLDTARLFSGITVHAAVEPTPGGAASDERADPQSYVLELKLHARVPAPNATIEDLAKVSPDLPRLLPGLAAMITPDSVSPFFKELYDTKLRILKESLVRLDQLLSRHNFYDCQTVLNLRNPESKRRAVLLQADMDVDADGSDSDRLPAGSGQSANFKPVTSYRWPKKSQIPNSYLGPAEERLKRYEGELAVKSTAPERKKELKAGIALVRDEIETLKKFSFLIGATDPYIVLPSGLGKADGGKVGDYCLVIFGDRIFPAIVGDIGPSDKAGEASLRIAKEINTAATAYNRPVSDLKVTYLVFPGTAETPFGPPDLEKLQARSEALVKEIGGAAVPLHHWENIIPPLPSPTHANPEPNTIGFAFRQSRCARHVANFDIRLSAGQSDSIAIAVSKAFTRDENEGPEIPDVPPTASLIGPGEKNYITAQGAQKLRDELQRLIEVTRPELADARDDPDAKRQLARLDQRIMQLEESLQSAEIVTPPSGANDVVRFGACVTVRESDGSETSYRIVGVDETDADENRVSWMSPIAKALLNRKRGERIRFKFPSGEETLEIIEISYE